MTPTTDLISYVKSIARLKVLGKRSCRGGGGGGGLFTVQVY